MTKEELAGVIDTVTGGNQSEYARMTGITGQQLRKLLSGTSGISGQTATIARLLLLLKEKCLLETAKRSLLDSALCATLDSSTINHRLTSMKPRFWKLSQGFAEFNFSDLLTSIEDRLVYVHRDTGAKGQSEVTQGQNFVSADIGDYFYLAHGNAGGIYLLGQFTGPANYFSSYGNGWIDRPFRIIARAQSQASYSGPNKWWTPNHNSTFVQIPENELDMFEELILQPYFALSIKEYDIR